MNIFTKAGRDDFSTFTWREQLPSESSFSFGRFANPTRVESTIKDSLAILQQENERTVFDWQKIRAFIENQEGPTTWLIAKYENQPINGQDGLSIELSPGGRDEVHIDVYKRPNIPMCSELEGISMIIQERYPNHFQCKVMLLDIGLPQQPGEVSEVDRVYYGSLNVLQEFYEQIIRGNS